jgi:hypothetical protein
MGMATAIVLFWSNKPNQATRKRRPNNSGRNGGAKPHKERAKGRGDPHNDVHVELSETRAGAEFLVFGTGKMRGVRRKTVTGATEGTSRPGQREGPGRACDRRVRS